MQFLYPTFLFALAALAIPVIIHLFHFRRFKRVYFTNVRFLKEVKEETSARSKLRNLLVLLLRLLAVLFLVLAFAQPFIPTGGEVQRGAKSVSIFIDNSFSMSALSQDVPLLDQAKQRARDVIEAYTTEDRFQILTHDFEGRHQRLMSQEDALALIDEIEITPEVRNLSQVLERQRQVLEEAENTSNRVIYQISDFQQSITDLSTYQDSTIQLNLLPLQAVQERNVYIDSVWFEAPVRMVNQTNPMFVKMVNKSDAVAENVRLSLNYEGQTKPEGTVSIPAGGEAVDTVNLTILRPGWHEVELAITDYPVNFDDKYLLTFPVAENIRALAINAGTPNRFLSAAFGGMEYFSLTNQNIQNISYSSFPEYQMIVLNELATISTGMAFELKNYIESGGNLLVFPPEDADRTAYNNFLNSLPANQLQSLERTEREVGQINTEEFVFQDVFKNRDQNIKLPVTQVNYQLSSFTNRREEPLLIYRDGSTFLGKYRIGGGHLYLCAAPLNPEANNLVQNGEIFIPMLYKMGISAASDPRVAYTIGEDEVIEADHRTENTDFVYHIQGAEEEFIPEQRVVGAKVQLGVNDQIKEAGLYQLFLERGEVLHQFAFNYNRKESDLAYLNAAELRKQVGGLAAVIQAEDPAVLTASIEQRSQGLTLWRWCLFLALLFLGLEILVLRFWR